jgi:Spy/CpxP family protein refolding chaperone
MKKLVLLALLLLAFSASAMDLPPGKWWRRPEVINILGLTDEQQSRLEAVSVKSANELIDLKGEVEKANIAMRAELDQPQLNREAIRRAAVRLNEARGRLFERELMMLVDMRSVLTEAQWNKMRQKVAQMQEERQLQRPNMRRRNQ